MAGCLSASSHSPVSKDLETLNNNLLTVRVRPPSIMKSVCGVRAVEALQDGGGLKELGGHNLAKGNRKWHVSCQQQVLLTAASACTAQAGGPHLNPFSLSLHTAAGQDGTLC